MDFLDIIVYLMLASIFGLPVFMIIFVVAARKRKLKLAIAMLVLLILGMISFYVFDNINILR